MRAVRALFGGAAQTKQTQADPCRGCRWRRAGSSACCPAVFGKRRKGNGRKETHGETPGQKGAEHTARSICRELLARTLPAGAADFGVLQTVAEELGREQGGQPDLYQLMMLVQLQKAMNGDTRAATFVRDCAGTSRRRRARGRWAFPTGTGRCCKS